MSAAWFSIDCVVGGTAFFRTNASTLLPREPQELEDAWERRVSHATLSPYTVRIAEQAAGLILRKGIVLSNKTQDADVDPYWEEFADSIDGRGTDLIAFARRVLISSLLYGHAGVLVDYPTREAAPSLQAERLAGIRPYFSFVDCKQIIGWRFSDDDPLAPMNRCASMSMSLCRLVSLARNNPADPFLEKGKYRVFRRTSDQGSTPDGADGWYVHEEGPISLPVVPLAIPTPRSWLR